MQRNIAEGIENVYSGVKGTTFLLNTPGFAGGRGGTSTKINHCREMNTEILCSTTVTYSLIDFYF